MTGKSELLLLAFLLLLQGNRAIPAAQDNSTDLGRARHLLDQGKTKEGMALLKEISLREPKLKGLAREMGIAFYKKSQFALAVPYLQQALEEDANDKETIQLLGLSYYFTGQPTSATPLLQDSQSWYRVANVDAMYVLGLCNLSTQNYDDAREAFAKIFDAPKDSPDSQLSGAVRFRDHGSGNAQDRSLQRHHSSQRGLDAPAVSGDYHGRETVPVPHPRPRQHLLLRTRFGPEVDGLEHLENAVPRAPGERFLRTPRRKNPPRVFGFPDSAPTRDTCGEFSRSEWLITTEAAHTPAWGQVFPNRRQAFRRPKFQVAVFGVVTGWQEDLFWAVCITNTDWRRWRHEKWAKIQNHDISCGTQDRIMR